MSAALPRRLAALVALALLAGCAELEMSRRAGTAARPGAAAPASVASGGLELLGEAILPAATFDGTLVGGLSGITYDAGRDRFYAVSDDPSSRSPARFYTLRLDLGPGGLEAVEIEAVTRLRERSGRPFARLVMDSEAIALTPGGTLLISSEGNVDEAVPPSLREFGLDGRQLRELKIPRRYRPRGGRPTGVRHNKAFEALALSRSGDRFYLASENAIHQDGPAADVGRGSTVRLQVWEYASGRVVAEHAYRVEPVARPPAAGSDFRTNGLVELVALGGGELLALERSFTRGLGNSVRLFHVSLHGADDVRRIQRLAGRRAAGITPVAKRLLLDLEELGLPLDNLEGMAFGPTLPDGRRTLVLISDDNFSAAQKTQLLAFAVSAARGDEPQTTDP